VSVLSREAILQANDLERELVAVPEWGGEVYVRGMSGTERDRYELGMYAARADLEGKAIVRARVVAYCAVDETGKSIFKPSDVEALGRKSANALDRVFSVAMRLSGTSPDAPEAAEESFEDAQSEPSTSGSPVI
jgi:hypothetical protein